ncbi:MAG: uroporphyrinogen decarboxylase [Candidatus Hydrogenedentes bacterium]|nr:uroporphyrinogen decarboxylase [Candidatus Hydrogenedentota bacterium]
MNPSIPGDPKLINDCLVRALRGEATEYTPVWLMRQAGRSDPAYLKLREEAGLPLEELFCHPAWAARITQLPQRFGVDALILFQDILTPLAPFGRPFVFRPGPVLEKPVRTAADALSLEPYEVARELACVGETLDRIHQSVHGALPVLGFAGAPLTLLVFLVEGQSFGDDISRTLSFLREHGQAAHAALERLTAVTVEYLEYQRRHGVVAVQLFESAAHVLPEAEYREFALPYQQRVFAALRGIVPTIHFARELQDLALLDAAGADVISLPHMVSIAEARAQLGEGRVFQGNLDNHLLAQGPPAAIREAAIRCVQDGGHRGHIFNLSHGLLRETPIAHILDLVRIVHEARA